MLGVSIRLAARRMVGEFRRQGGLRNSLGKAKEVLDREGVSGIRKRIFRKARDLFRLPAGPQLQPSCLSESAQAAYQAYYENYRNQLISSQFRSPEFVTRRPDMCQKAPTPVKLIAYYLPQYHPFPENDLWWGKGFTEWTNVAKAQPHFLGHYQPRLPADLGFYDLRLQEIQMQQIDMARQYGIYGFCYYYYWFSGKRLMDGPLRQMLANKRMDFPFCISWANENWTRRWDGLEDEILIQQEYLEEDDLAFIMDVGPVLKDERYIKVDGKPLLIVYGIHVLPDPARAARTWREYCLKAGLGEIYLAAPGRIPGFDPRKYGCDAAIEFPPVEMPLTWDVPNQTFLFPNCEAKVYDYRTFISEAKKGVSEKTEFPLFHGVMPSWDNTARRPDGKSYIFTNACPEEYAKWLHAVCEHSDSRHSPEEKLVFINAWNEWAEGAYLEPDRKYGYAYLEATAQVMESIQAKNRTFTYNVNGLGRKEPSIAVILHLYYLDLWDEIVSYLENIPEPFDLYVSVKEGCDPSAIEKILEKYPTVHIRPVENRGRDIAPFLKVLAEIMPRGYRAVCKIHTKKSDHLKNGDGWRPEHGDDWRGQLFKELLGSKKAVQEILAAFRKDPTLGMIGAHRDLMHFKRAVGENQALVRELQSRLHLPQSNDFLFFAGSMFWFRPESLVPILELNLANEDFPMEAGQVDGTLAHAVERVVSLSAAKLNYKVCAVENTQIKCHEVMNIEVNEPISNRIDRDIDCVTDNHVKYYVEDISVKKGNLYIKGWAFWEGKNANEVIRYFSLREEKPMKLHFFETSSEDRPDVAQYFQDKQYRQSGFRALIKAKDLPEGNYRLGMVLYNLTDKKHYLKESTDSFEVKW